MYLWLTHGSPWIYLFLFETNQPFEPMICEDLWGPKWHINKFTAVLMEIRGSLSILTFQNLRLKVTLEAGRKAVEYLETLRGQRKAALSCAWWWAKQQLMSMFPTKWWANEQQGGGWAPTSETSFLKLLGAGTSNVLTHHSMDLNGFASEIHHFAWVHKAQKQAAPARPPFKDDIPTNEVHILPTTIVQDFSRPCFFFFYVGSLYNNSSGLCLLRHPHRSRCPLFLRQEMHRLLIANSGAGGVECRWPKTFGLGNLTWAHGKPGATLEMMNSYH